MDGTSALRWALTGVFVVCVGLFVVRVLAANAWLARTVWSLHALMALAMVAMAGPRCMHPSPIVYVLIFTAGALVFAYLALFVADDHLAVYHSVMMASMVLMALAMSSTPLATQEIGAMGAMPGMDPSDGGAPVSGSSLPDWAVVACGVVATFFLGSTLRWFFVVVRGPQRPFADLLMAAGMGVSFVALTM